MRRATFISVFLSRIFLIRSSLLNTHAIGFTSQLWAFIFGCCFAYKRFSLPHPTALQQVDDEIDIPTLSMKVEGGRVNEKQNIKKKGKKKICLFWRKQRPK